MNKTCFFLIVLMCPASLYAGVTMVSQTTQTGKCNFRVDKCETSVAEDPSYIRFQDGNTSHTPIDVTPLYGNPAMSRSRFAFTDYSPPQHVTVDELIALIQKKLSNCPEVTFSYDADSGDITLHYLKSTCDCDCDWTVNVRNVKADDFVWTRTRDNYSPRLGQLERRKFHTTNKQDADDIESACAQICQINSWTVRP